MELKISKIAKLAALILSHWCCIVVAAEYEHMRCGIAHLGYSAPVSLAFIYMVPFVIGISICLLISYVFKKKHNKKLNSEHKK